MSRCHLMMTEDARDGHAARELPSDSSLTVRPPRARVNHEASAARTAPQQQRQHQLPNNRPHLISAAKFFDDWGPLHLHWRRCRCCPQIDHTEGVVIATIEAQSDASSPAVYASRRALPLAMQDSLPAGGLRLCRAGVEPAGALRKVSDQIILLPRTSPGARSILHAD